MLEKIKEEKEKQDILAPEVLLSKNEIELPVTTSLLSSLTSSSQISAASAVSSVGLFAQAKTSNDKVMAMAKSVEKAVDVEEIKDLLKWVTEGHLEEAEKLLQKNPKLALVPGTIKDLSERTFENITAFQLAVWYLDDEMWEIILKYLDKAQAKLQLEALENDRKDIIDKHGLHFNFDPLIKSYDDYIKNYRTWSDDQSKEHWCKKVGGEQHNVPAWFIYAFCEKDVLDWGDSYERKVRRSTHLTYTSEGRRISTELLIWFAPWTKGLTKPYATHAHRRGKNKAAAIDCEPPLGSHTVKGMWHDRGCIQDVRTEHLNKLHATLNDLQDPVKPLVSGLQK